MSAPVVGAVAEALAVSWSTANNAMLTEDRRVSIDAPFRRGAGVRVDEHASHHTRRGDKYVTVITDLTPVRDGRPPAGMVRPRMARQAC